MPSPDLTGFRDAMVTMRQEMGTDVPFFTRSNGTYPPGTAIDPETQEPFDPTVAESGSGWASASYRVGVYTAPVANDRTDDAVANPVGWFENGNIVLDMAPDDYASAQDATEVEWNGYRYEISDVEGSEIRNVEHRKLVFARRK
jgi:hypothetical protein